jgi:predicted acylesterase/phospholipase RssA
MIRKPWSRYAPPVLYEGHGQVDGGVVNNLPTDVMRRRTSGPVFAVSLGHAIPGKLPYESYPSPWRLMRERLPGFRRRRHHHAVPKVIMRLATMQDLAAFDARARLADFGIVDQMIASGHAYALDRLRQWTDDNEFVERLGSAGIHPRS